MVEIVNSALQTVASATNALLGAIKIQTGNCVDVGATSLRLNRPGFYLVTVTGSIGNLTNTAVNLGLVNNTTGIEEPGGSVQLAGLTAGATDTRSFSITTVIQVPKGCGCVQNAKSISLRNFSVAPITITNLNTVVTRLA